MSLTQCASGIGRSALFLILWALMTVGLNICLLIFCGALTLGLGGFGFLPEPPANFDSISPVAASVYWIAFGLALIGGMPFSVRVAFFGQKLTPTLDEAQKIVSYSVWWMMLTVLFVFFFALVIGLIFSWGSYDPSASEAAKDALFRTTLVEARYFLLFALVASGVLSGLYLSSENPEER